MSSYLGQNFLIDTKIKQFIANKISKLYNELGCNALIEIGPGKGALTKLIKGISPNFLVIEKDEKLIKDGKLNVEGLEDTKVILSDVLKVDTKQLLDSLGLIPEKTLIVGNLPYYITSPIFRKFFGYGEQEYAGGIFMIQKEVGDKIKSDASKKSYLRWLLNYKYDVLYTKNVPPKCFKPAPKVTSAVIQISPKIESNQSRPQWGNLIDFLEDFSPYSRKTLGAISTINKKKGGNHRTIPDDIKNLRLEELSWEDLTKIGKA